MTREEAIRILDPETTAEALAEIEYYGGFRGRTKAANALYDACILAVAAIREQEERHWIPVTDRLPMEDGYYLVTINYFGDRQCIDIRCFAKDGETVDEYDLAGQKYVWYFYDSEYGHVSTDFVTHWMPLPEPPKEVS